jgi:transcriptional regulator with XRE-family HTH domain
VNPIAVAFGNNVRSHREGTKLSQEALAWAAGLHRTEIGLLERGERLPRIDTLVKVAAGLGVRPEALLDQIEWRPPPIASGSFDLAPSSAASEGSSDA